MLMYSRLRFLKRMYIGYHWLEGGRISLAGRVVNNNIPNYLIYMRIRLFKKFISASLIIFLVLIPFVWDFYSNKAEASLNFAKGAYYSIAILCGILLVTSIIISFLGVDGWIREDIASKNYDYYPFDKKFVLKIKEKWAPVYQEPNIEVKIVGYVYKDEIYDFIESKEENQIIWYKIRINKGHRIKD